MPLILPVGYFNCRYIFSVAGLVEPMGWSLAFAPGLGLTAESVAEDASLAFTTPSIGALSSWNDEFTYLGTSCTEMLPSGPSVATFPLSRVGTNAVDAPPVNCSILVSKQTALGGRKNRGRFNIPSGKVEEGNVNGAGFITGAVLAILQTQVTQFFDALIAAPLQPVLLHSNPVDVPTEITGFSVSSQIATQRRRMR